MTSGPTAELAIQTDSTAAASVLPRVMELRGTYKGGGGPDKTILNSAAQHDAGRVVILVTYLRDPRDEEFQIGNQAKKLGIRYLDVPDASLFDLRCLLKIRKLLRLNRIDILHAHDDKSLLYGWMLKLLNPRLIIMYTCHSHGGFRRSDFKSSMEYARHISRKKFQIFLMKRFAKPILVVSAETKGRLAAGGIAPKDLQVIHNGIDTVQWACGKGKPVLRQELGVGPDSYLIGTVARITAEKDLPTFYQVALETVRRIKNVKFVIVGDGHGDLLSVERERVKALGIDNLVAFTGHRSDLLDVYASLDVFLITSTSEALPNTLLEAMALQVPSVATIVGGIPEVIQNEEQGFLCPPGAASSMADAICRLLADADLRKRVGSAARDRILQKFDFSNRVRWMESFYEQLMHSQNGRSPASIPPNTRKG